LGKNRSQIAVKTIKIILLLFFDRYSVEEISHGTKAKNKFQTKKSKK